MASLATKILVFSIIMSFGFSMMAGLKIGVEGGACAATYSQIGSANTNQGGGVLGVTGSGLLNLILNNVPSFVLTGIGLLTQNQFWIFAGFAGTLLGLVNTTSSSVFNACFGNNIGTFLSNLLNLLYILGVVSWYGQRGEP